MNRYSPLLPDKVRQLPSQFSWLDQRLAREHYFLRASADAWMLYLFLVTVSDARGLSCVRPPNYTVPHLVFEIPIIIVGCTNIKSTLLEKDERLSQQQTAS